MSAAADTGMANLAFRNSGYPGRSALTSTNTTG
jgi:hypothetical protein